jgi:uncharacterized protein (TIGR02147 family)
VPESESQFIEPRVLLQRELKKRCERNPRYSLRAFSASLGLSHTVVSLVLSGKRPLSKKAAEKVCGSLALSGFERQSVLRRSSLEALPPSSEILDLDAFSIISDWYHFAILSLVKLPNAESDSRWIARQIGINPVEARLAVERLLRVGLLVEKNGKWKRSKTAIQIDNRQSTTATRKFQTQLTHRSLESLENDSLDRRDHTSVTFPMDAKSMGKARDRITKFRHELCAEFESIGNDSDVYTMTVQLFPLTKNKKDK